MRGLLTEPLRIEEIGLLDAGRLLGELRCRGGLGPERVAHGGGPREARLPERPPSGRGLCDGGRGGARHCREVGVAPSVDGHLGEGADGVVDGSGIRGVSAVLVDDGQVDGQGPRGRPGGRGRRLRVPAPRREQVPADQSPYLLRGQPRAQRPWQSPAVGRHPFTDPLPQARLVPEGPVQCRGHFPGVEDGPRVEAETVRDVRTAGHLCGQARGVAGPASSGREDCRVEPVAVALGPVQVEEHAPAVGPGGREAAMIGRGVEVPVLKRPSAVLPSLPGRVGVRGPRLAFLFAGRRRRGRLLLRSPHLRGLRVRGLRHGCRGLAARKFRGRVSGEDRPGRCRGVLEPDAPLRGGVELVPVRQAVGGLAYLGVGAGQSIGMGPQGVQVLLDLVQPPLRHRPLHLRPGRPDPPVAHLGPAVVGGFGERVLPFRDVEGRAGVLDGQGGQRLAAVEFGHRAFGGGQCLLALEAVAAAQLPVVLVGGDPGLLRVGHRVPGGGHLGREEGVVDQAELPGDVLAHPGKHLGLGLHGLRQPLRVAEGTADDAGRGAVPDVVPNMGDGQPRGGDGEQERPGLVRLGVHGRELFAGLARGRRVEPLCPRTAAHLVGTERRGGGRRTGVQDVLGRARPVGGRARAVRAAVGVLELRAVRDGEQPRPGQVRLGVQGEAAVRAAPEAAVGEPGDLVAVRRQGVPVERGQRAVGRAVLQALGRS